MSTYRPGLKVVVIDEDKNIEKGVIDEVYDTAKIAIVSVGDMKRKVHFSDMALDTEEPEPDPEIEDLTPEKFDEVTWDLILEELKKYKPGASREFALAILLSYTKELKKVICEDDPTL